MNPSILRSAATLLAIASLLPAAIAQKAPSIWSGERPSWPHRDISAPAPSQAAPASAAGATTSSAKAASRSSPGEQRNARVSAGVRDGETQLRANASGRGQVSATNRSAHVAGMAKPPGAGLRVGSPQMQEALRAPPPPPSPAPRYAPGASVEAAVPVLGLPAERAAMPRQESLAQRASKLGVATTQIDCTTNQAAAIGSLSPFKLSTVNQVGEGFWIDQEADETALVLKGCFDERPGQVRVQRMFPGGALTANVLSWSKHVIAAKVPRITGVPDGAITVRAVFRDGSSTNERKGVFYAKRETHAVEMPRYVRASGPCTDELRNPPNDRFAMIVGTKALPAFGSVLYDVKTCVPASASQTELHVPLQLGFEISSMAWDFEFGSGGGSLLSADRAVLHWQPEIRTYEQRVAAIKTGDMSVPLTRFTVRLWITGPAGVAPFRP
jgi:hypothetical protein